MVIPYFHSWEFDILQEAENVSGPAAPEQGRGPTAFFRLYLIPEQGKLSTYFGIKQLSSEPVCCAQHQAGTQVEQQSTLSKDCGF